MAVFVADFETRAGDNAIKEGKTWVWAWAITNIYDIENVWVGNSISTFFSFIKRLGAATIYFHNLKFDGRFICDYLLKNGYNFVETRKEFNESAKNFTGLISEQGIFYTLSIHNRDVKIEFRDSLRKMPVSVDKIAKSYHTKYQKLSIDYVEDRPENHPLTPEEIEYIKNDVRVVAEALRKGFYDNGYTKMTIGADALFVFKDMYGSKLFNIDFPKLSVEEDTFVRKSYRGGYCFCRAETQATTINEVGNTYDVNSLYPSMMHSNEYILDGKKRRNLYPIGKGVYYKGKYSRERFPSHPLFVQHLQCHFVVREGFLPTIQLKHVSTFAQNEYVTDSKTSVDLWLTSVDLEVFLKHYEMTNVEWIDGYAYRGKLGIFDEYINHFMQIKETAKGAERQVAKLYLNNLYGKFGTNPVRISKKPRLSESGVVKYERIMDMNEDGTVKKPEPNMKKSVYVPIATFCTAYARRFTICHAQENYERILYIDTDSIHCTGEAVGLLIHPTHLCAWKHETTWNQGRFLRQKAYVEHVTHEEGEEVEPYYNVKCGGMTQAVKNKFLEEIEAGEKTIDDFDFGLRYDDIKLQTKTVNGGVILVPTKFELEDTRKYEKLSDKELTDTLEGVIMGTWNENKN